MHFVISNFFTDLYDSRDGRTSMSSRDLLLQPVIIYIWGILKRVRSHLISSSSSPPCRSQGIKSQGVEPIPDLPKSLRCNKVMNYIAYHQGDELFPNYFARHGNNQGEPRPQTTKSTPESSLKKMLVAHPPMPDDHSSLCYPPIKLGRGNPSSSGGTDVEGCKKKVIHRDVERQRRHEMATLYASLRTLLPLEYLKGKRSISDHMNEAANYIKHQQKKIHELTKKRDGLRRRVLLSSNIDASTSSSDVKIAYDCAPSVTVRPCWAGVEVLITAFRDQTSLSTVIIAMEEEGLAVVSCSSTYVQNRCYHTFKSEVTEVGEAELRKFEQKLNDLVLPSNWFFMVNRTISARD